MDHDTSRSRGFGFVTFASNEEASSAIQALDGQDLHGRRVRVNYAHDNRRTSGGYSGGGGYGSGYGSGGDVYSGCGGGYPEGGGYFGGDWNYGGRGGNNYSNCSGSAATAGGDYGSHGNNTADYVAGGLAVLAVLAAVTTLPAAWWQ